MCKKRLLNLIVLVCCSLMWACGLQKDVTAELTDEEKAMPEAKYYSTDFVPVPDEIMDAAAHGPMDPNKALALADINQLLKPGYLEMENGYALLDNNTAYVAARTDMPFVTRDMIHWWFWWHALNDIRYKIWCPGDHYAISVDDLARYTDETVNIEKRYLNNPHYPVEDIGSGVMNLSIRFMSPEAFGFDTSRFKRNGIKAVVCGVVGFKIGETVIEHTYMCHLFRKKGAGVELRSRFWLGKKFDYPRLRKLVITEELALDMMMHCSQEYNHLAGILPAVYAEFGRQVPIHQK